MTEYESERERLATVTDLQLRFMDMAAAEGKNSFTIEELNQALWDYAREIKQHK